MSNKSNIVESPRSSNPRLRTEAELKLLMSDFKYGNRFARRRALTLMTRHLRQEVGYHDPTGAKKYAGRRRLSWKTRRNT